MTTFRKKKHDLTEKIFSAITFADSERYEVDETKLNPGELKIMKDFLKSKGFIV